jgi:hypothetical protein
LTPARNWPRNSRPSTFTGMNKRFLEERSPAQGEEIEEHIAEGCSGFEAFT